MLAKCANPTCDATFRYLHGGKLFVFDMRRGAKAEKTEAADRNPQFEYFWLCDRCFNTMDVVIDKSGGVVVSGLPSTRMPLRAVV